MKQTKIATPAKPDRSATPFKPASIDFNVSRTRTYLQGGKPMIQYATQGPNGWLITSGAAAQYKETRKLHTELVAFAIKQEQQKC